MIRPERFRCRRDQTIFDPWHYVPALARKPGALRNGAPFKNRVLPAGLDRLRRKLAVAAMITTPDALRLLQGRRPTSPQQ